MPTVLPSVVAAPLVPQTENIMGRVKMKEIKTSFFTITLSLI
jgi:hypothetical protein